MAKKHALRLPYVQKFTSAGLASLYSDTVPPDQLWCIQLLSVEGDLATSGGNTRARVYIDGHGYKHYITEQDAPSANTLYWKTTDTWLMPGERLVAEWDQAQVNTTLNMLLLGYWIEEKEGIVT